MFHVITRIVWTTHCVFVWGIAVRDRHAYSGPKLRVFMFMVNSGLCTVNNIILCAYERLTNIALLVIAS